MVEISLDPLNPQSQTKSNVSLGSVLLSMRRMRGSTQVTISREAGISRSQLSRMETNSVTPNLSTFLRILRALGVSNIYLKLAGPKKARGKLHARN